MDMEKEYKDMEKANQLLEESHHEYIKAIKPILRDYISDRYFKKGDHISKFYESEEKVTKETNEILEYIETLYEASQLNFKYAKILYERSKKS